MAYAPNQRHVDVAFSSGSLLQNGKPVEFQCREIGHLLKISAGTVNQHLKHIYNKMNVRSKTELIYKLSN